MELKILTIRMLSANMCKAPQQRLSLLHQEDLPWLGMTSQLQAAKFCEVAVIVSNMQANHEDSRLLSHYGIFYSCFWFKNKQAIKNQQKSEY